MTPHPSDAQKYPVPMPPPGASARQVVLAYRHALDAHDTATAEQLSTAGFRATTQSWLQSTASIQHITIQNVTHYAGQREYDANVTFRYTSQPGHSDGSFADGSHYWGYTLIPGTADCSSATTAPANGSRADDRLCGIRPGQP